MKGSNQRKINKKQKRSFLIKNYISQPYIEKLPRLF